MQHTMKESRCMGRQSWTILKIERRERSLYTEGIEMLNQAA